MQKHITVLHQVTRLNLWTPEYQIRRFVLGHSPLKLMMFLGRPKHGDLSRLLEKAMPVYDDMLLPLALPTVSLLSIGLLAD